MRKRFKRRHRGNEDMVLQITSMADIFTILLVFLLKSLSSGVSNIAPTAEMQLPSARSSDTMSETTKLEIGETSILLDAKPVLSLTRFQFASDELERDGTPRALNQAFIAQKKGRDPASAETQKEGHLTVLADERAPYAVIQAAMASAANHGFTDFHLVVVEDQ